MSVGEVCRREVVIVDPKSPVRDALRLMREHHVGDVVAVEERGGVRVPVGILTDRDVVVELLAEDADLDRLSVGDVMSFELVAAREGDDVIDTLKMMRGKGVRRVPVVDGAGALVGILTMDDLLDLIAEQLTDVVQLIGNQQRRERETRT